MSGRMVSVPPSTMQRWLLQANVCLSLLILLPGSQQDRFSWAPAMTFGMLLSWGLTGASLIFFHNRSILENRQWIVLYPLQIWLPFVIALQTGLGEAILLLPLSTTAAMIYLAVRQGPSTCEISRLPGPVTEPRRGRTRRWRKAVLK